MNEIKEVNDAAAEVANRNAKTALQHSEKTRLEITERVNTLENLVREMYGQIAQLQNKYNLLLTKNFNRGSTTESDAD